MSSPLDGRIRAIAREEAAALLGGGSAATVTEGPDRMSVLEQELVDLRGALKRAFARLDAIEQAPGTADQESKPTARRTRKTAETSE
jgi:hypothetical protein